MHSVTTANVIRIQAAVWSRDSYPDEIVTDSGTHLTRREFQPYPSQRGVRPFTCSQGTGRWKGSTAR